MMITITTTIAHACAFLFFFSFLIRCECRVLRCRVCNREFAEHKGDKHIVELMDRVVLHGVEIHGLDLDGELDRVDQEARARGWLE